MTAAGVARAVLTGIALCAADIAGLALEGANRLRPRPATRTILRADEDAWTDGSDL